MSMIGIAIDLVSMAAMFAAGALAGRLWERGLKEPVPQSLMPRQIPMPVLHEPRKLVQKGPSQGNEHKPIDSPFAPKRWNELNAKIEAMPRNRPSTAVSSRLSTHRSIGDRLSTKGRNLPNIDWGS